MKNAKTSLLLVSSHERLIDILIIESVYEMTRFVSLNTG